MLNTHPAPQQTPRLNSEPGLEPSTQASEPAQNPEILGQGEFQVNTYTTGFQDNSAVAMDQAGDFVVTWHSYCQAHETANKTCSYGIYAQRYDSSGAKTGSEFQVNRYPGIWQGPPVVGMDAEGDFVIAWTSEGQDGSDSGIFAQVFTD